MAFNLTAVSIGEPIDMMKPPTCSCAINCSTRVQALLDVGV